MSFGKRVAAAKAQQATFGVLLPTWDVRDDVRRLRLALREDWTTFGHRFAVQPTTVRDWESGHRHPHPLVLRKMRELTQTIARTVRLSRENSHGSPQAS